jgi:hypothetical protein
MSASEVLGRYHGIDGTLWPGDPTGHGVSLERGLAPLDQLGLVRDFLESIRSRSRVDLLLVDREGGGGGETGTRLLGYDLGFLESEFNVYSLLYHEIVFPRLVELACFGSMLNPHLLLDSVQGSERILQAVETLEREGVVFETSESPESCAPLAIFAIRR